MIILKNRGEIDLDLIRIMGLSIKESDNPFGYFGTGLKYAIAVFLREKVEFSLWIGTNKYSFFSEAKVFHEGTERETTTNLCKMQGPHDSIDLPFTTDYGRNWEQWQAYREIDCNCMDEDGEIFNADSVRGEAGYTIFCIEEIDTRGIFLRDSKAPLLFSNDAIEIYEGESECMYYRGVRAKDLDRPSLHTYNIKSECDLTEDRRLCYDFQIDRVISESVTQMTSANKSLIKSVVTAKSEHYESTLDMGNYNRGRPSADFKQTVLENAKDASHSAKSFVATHTPKAPETRAERRAKLMKSVDILCRDFGLESKIEHHPSLLQITGDLLAEESAEQSA